MLKTERRLCIFLLLACAMITAAYGQATGTTVPTAAPNAVTPGPKDTTAEKLHIANPFYLPYARDFQITFQTAWLQNRVRTDMPAQTALGNALPAGFSETQGNTFSTSLGLRYGIFDRVGLGLSTDYYIRGPAKTTGNATTSNTNATLPTLNGFTGIEFSVYVRLAGLRPGQIYVDAMLAVRPGIGSSTTNATGPGRSSTTGTVAIGYNFRYFTFGIGASAYSAPTASVTTTGTTSNGNLSVSTSTTVSAPPTNILSGQAVLQAELKYAYVRGSLAYAKDTDAADTLGSTAKYPFWIYAVSVGFKLGASAMLDFTWVTTPEIRGDEYYTGYTNAFRQYVTSGPTARYLLTFSFRF